MKLASIREHRYSATFGQILLDIAHAEATDPRDKVYGVLGLLGNPMSETLMEPDYSKSIGEIYADAAWTLLDEDPLSLYGRFPLQPLRKEHIAEPQSCIKLRSWTTHLMMNSQYGEFGYNYHLPKHAIRYNVRPD